MKKNKRNQMNFIIVFVVIAIALMGGYVYISSQNNKPVSTLPPSEKFNVLKSYLVGSGYECENLNNSGTSCKKSNDYNSYIFFRYDDGVQYLTDSLNYKINIVSRKNGNEITFQTKEGAFVGYENKKYNCVIDGKTFISNITACKDEKGNALDNDVYMNVIRNSVNELKNILDKSGHDVSLIINQYKWE